MVVVAGVKDNLVLAGRCVGGGVTRVSSMYNVM